MTLQDPPLDPNRAIRGEGLPAEPIRPSRTGLWIAAAAAGVLILAIFFLVSSRGHQAELQAAQDQGRVQAEIDSNTAEAHRAAANAADIGPVPLTAAGQAAMNSADDAAARAEHESHDVANSQAQAAQAATAAAAASSPPR